jgi:hypothetical protein
MAEITTEIRFASKPRERDIHAYLSRRLEEGWEGAADHRLVTNIERPGQVVTGQFRVTAHVFGASPVHDCRCRINEGLWTPLHPQGLEWESIYEAPPQQFTLTVEATDITGSTGTDTIIVAAPEYQPPQRIVDGSDANALSAWPERHLLGTRLGPNRHGRQW